MANFDRVIKQLEKERNDVSEQLSQISSAVTALKGMGARGGAGKSASRSIRVMSASARRRIAAAQRTRWAKWRREQKRAA